MLPLVGETGPGQNCETDKVGPFPPFCSTQYSSECCCLGTRAALRVTAETALRLAPRPFPQVDVTPAEILRAPASVLQPTGRQGLLATFLEACSLYIKASFSLLTVF